MDTIEDNDEFKDLIPHLKIYLLKLHIFQYLKKFFEQ